MTKVLIIHYTFTDNTKKMAKTAAEEAKQIEKTDINHRKGRLNVGGIGV